MSWASFSSEVKAAAWAQNPEGYATAEVLFGFASQDDLAQAAETFSKGSAPTTGNGAARRARKERSIAAGRSSDETNTQRGVRQFWSSARKLWFVLHPGVDPPTELKKGQPAVCPKGTKPRQPRQRPTSAGGAPTASTSCSRSPRCGSARWQWSSGSSAA